MAACGGWSIIVTPIFWRQKTVVTPSKEPPGLPPWTCVGASTRDYLARVEMWNAPCFSFRCRPLVEM